jgi:hypothetical protein
MTGRRWQLLVLAVALAGAATACDDEIRTEDVCAHVCGCVAPFPSQRRSCIEECVGGFDVEPACGECVFAASCDDIQSLFNGTGAVCEAECGLSEGG